MGSAIENGSAATLMGTDKEQILKLQLEIERLQWHEKIILLEQLTERCGYKFEPKVKVGEI